MGGLLLYNLGYPLSVEGYAVKNYATSSYAIEQEILWAINGNSFDSVDYLIVQYRENELE